MAFIVDPVSVACCGNFGIIDPSQKRFNHKGTQRRDLDASAFLHLHETLKRTPDILMSAEESTAWPYSPVQGVGFNLKLGHGLDE